MKNNNIFISYSIFLLETLKLHHNDHHLHPTMTALLDTAVYICNTLSNITAYRALYHEPNGLCRYYNLHSANGLKML